MNFPNTNLQIFSTKYYVCNIYFGFLKCSILRKIASFDQYNKKFILFFQLRNIGKKFVDSCLGNSWKQVVRSIIVQGLLILGLWKRIRSILILWLVIESLTTLIVVGGLIAAAFIIEMIPGILISVRLLNFKDGGSQKARFLAKNQHTWR